MRLDPSNISPFQDTFVREDDSWTKLYKLRSLPVLQDPIATIVHDDSATKHSYMLILGTLSVKAGKAVIIQSLFASTWSSIPGE